MAKTKINTQKKTNTTRKEGNNMSTTFKYVCEAYKTKNGNVMFNINGHKYIIMQPTALDVHYNLIRSEYVVKEIVQNNNTKEDSNKEAAL